MTHTPLTLPLPDVSRLATDSDYARDVWIAQLLCPLPEGTVIAVHPETLNLIDHSTFGASGYFKRSVTGYTLFNLPLVTSISQERNRLRLLIPGQPSIPHEEHLANVARPYEEFISKVVAHFAKGRAELLDRACQAAWEDPLGRGILVQDFQDRTRVSLSPDVPKGTIQYQLIMRDYAEGCGHPNHGQHDHICRTFEAPGIPTSSSDDV